MAMLDHMSENDQEISINTSLGAASVAATVFFVGSLISHAILIIAGYFLAVSAAKLENGY
jgi:hypothetical protein